jgi:hypothetical protein
MMVGELIADPHGGPFTVTGPSPVDTLWAVTDQRTAEVVIRFNACTLAEAQCRLLNGQARTPQEQAL